MAPPLLGATTGERSAPAPPASTVPARATGVELLGPLAGSGFRDPPSLVRRADGQTLQLTPVLYGVLEAIDGRRTHQQISDRLAVALGVAVAADDVAFLVEAKLRPLGVLRGDDGTEPVAERANPLLALRCRLVVADQQTTDRLVAPFTPLFRAPVVAATIAAFVACSGWVLFEKGLAAPTRHVLYQPGLLLLVFALTAVSAGFHELGHAAACRYGGATPGAMGVGLYLVWPAFYTDVSDSYRLDRAGRLRVDVGGLYFNAVFAVGAFAGWLVTGWDALLLLVPLQVLQMLRQLLPLVRLDGYHILADLTGVPDLFGRIRPVLAAALPWRRTGPEARALRPWARIIVTAWVFLVVPVLALALLVIVVGLPRAAATAWDSLGLQASAVGRRWSGGDPAGTILGLVSILALVVPLLSTGYLLGRIGRRLWRATGSDAALRVTATLATSALLVAAAASWWPRGQYRPIEAGERGTVVDVARSVAGLEPVSAVRAAGVTDRDASLADLPRSAPAGATDGAVEAIADGSADLPDRWRYLFTLPDPPGEGDNQALAVNYTDGALLVDIALSLVWVLGDVADETNQAYALANCQACTTVAIAVQLLLIGGDAEIIVPRNEAVAVNVGCVACTTYALAIQLIFTLTEPLDDAAVEALASLWSELETIAASAGTVPLETTMAAIVAVTDEIQALLDQEIGPPVSGAEVTSDPTATAGTDVGSSPSTTSEPVSDTTTTTEPETTTTTTTTSTTEPETTTTAVP